ncbi:ComF family protein [Alloscardovia venturai]|uniref:ComF family protein n=1 Tax=Alloscardovia venturai TaxID=1769421 RepID=A0ABW2Y3N2_9BIFI
MRDSLEICVIPVPSSEKSIQQRGRVHILPIACAVCEGLEIYSRQSKTALKSHVCRALTIEKHTKKSVTQSDRRQRSTRLLHSLRLCAPHRMNHHCVILVDDIATTGSTLRACARKLKRHGADVLCAVVIADSSLEEEQ